MGDDLTLRLPPLLLLKLERGAAHLEMSRSAYISSILKRAVEGGRPIIFTADPVDLSTDKPAVTNASDTGLGSRIA